MAELVLKIGDGAKYQDGDVLCAFSDLRISHVHLQHLCCADAGGFNTEGRYIDRDFQELYKSKVHRYRFDRISEREFMRTDLVTGEVAVGGNDSPDVDLLMDVALYIARRKRNDPGLLFGPDGEEYWFAGDITPEPDTLDDLWLAVEDRLSLSKDQPEFALWPLGRQDIRSHLAIRTTDFTEPEAEYLLTPELELNGNGEVVKDERDQPRVKSNRNIRIDWRELLADLRVSESDVLDREIPVGRDVTIRGKLKHHSKEQRQQSDRQKLRNKMQERP